MDLVFRLHYDCYQSHNIKQQHHQQYRSYNAANTFLNQKTRVLPTGLTNDTNDAQRRMKGLDKTKTRCNFGFQNGFFVHNKIRCQRRPIQMLFVMSFVTLTTILALQSDFGVRLLLQRPLAGDGVSRRRQWNGDHRVFGILNRQGSNTNRPKLDRYQLQFYLVDDQYNNETGAYLNIPLIRNKTTSSASERNIKPATESTFKHERLTGFRSDKVYEARMKSSVVKDETDIAKSGMFSNTVVFDQSIVRQSNNALTSSRKRGKVAVASLASLGDIMDGLSTPSLPPSPPVDSQSQPTTVPQTLEQKYGISNPLDRMVVTANGNLQRLVSSYYDSPVSVIVDSCSVRQEEPSKALTYDSSTEGNVWDRTVRLIVHDRVFCTATSIITVYDPYCQQLVESNQIGIGQLFRYLDILPEFILHDAGYNNEGECALWRTYTLQCKELSCYIREDFTHELWNIRPAN